MRVIKTTKDLIRERAQKIVHERAREMHLKVHDILELSSDLKLTLAFVELVDKTAKETGEEKGAVADRLRTELAYYAAYYSDEVRRRLEKLLGASHPVLGSVDSPNAPTPEEVFRLGLEAGKKLREMLLVKGR